MKKSLILAATAASAALVGLMTACSTGTPDDQADAQPFPREQQCADIPRPADPHGFIGDNWPKDDSCLIFNMNHPGEGVDADQAKKIVFDARMKSVTGKRDLVMLVQQGNKQAENPTGVVTDFAGAVAEREATLKQGLADSSLALQGQAPEGFRIEYLKNAADSHSASPGLTPGK
ncbi:hypothetical protein [Mycobacteroides abscessus]|uniref:hypothetical protein n=1 Tax=Mycobacteroides abscessus TaxID=36809 RepID=UPI0009A61676|nr:hypothetical protein [Mycobacteroides abscessus]SKP38459.1 putative lipoprotein [Mycobacteroides abscessus subsp. abscessus]